MAGSRIASRRRVWRRGRRSCEYSSSRFHPSDVLQIRQDTQTPCSLPPWALTKTLGVTLHCICCSDCWWYPVQTGGAAPGSKHPDWCVSDWVLPEEYYPNGQGGLRKRQGVPLMMYFPNLCVDNAWNKGGKYTWSDTAAESGFVLPIANQSERFWNDMFDYGTMLASKSVNRTAPAWPGTWAPQQVLAGWQGQNLAAYETDFYHNIVSATPELRQVLGAGEEFLGGIDKACASHNMTAQLCAGNPPSFLEALTMPRITNARASIDYDWDGDPTKNTGTRGNNGAHNWASPDNGWVFWATRIAPSKDNFWSSFRDLYKDGGGQDSGRNGKDAQLHALAAVLSTGPVGLGDTCVGQECMVNATLVHRLARADGILLRPDRPLAPVDVMFGALLGSTQQRSMPGLCTPAEEKAPDAPRSQKCGSRLWQTHATVWTEDPAKAPELATAPTRRLVSHAGVDATAQASVPAALATAVGAVGSGGGGEFLLQHIVVSVDQPESFDLQVGDLYPPLPPTLNKSVVLVRSATDGGKQCVAGTDAIASGCVTLVDVSAAKVVPTATTPLFDVSTANATCSQPPYAGGVLPAGPNCLHTVEVWQVWVVESEAEFVLLGDCSKFVSLSGYRFRLPSSNGSGGNATAAVEEEAEHEQEQVATPRAAAGVAVGESLVVVGMPDEEVEVTYLRRSAKSRAGVSWIVHVQQVVIGPDGRTLATLE